MTNPYAGQEPYATAWQTGYDYGSQQPGTDQPTPPDFSGWGYDDVTTGHVGEIWQEGVLAGRAGGGIDDGESGGFSQQPHLEAEHSYGPKVHTVKFWLNAFIAPAHVDGPPGYGVAYHYEYFSGDDRGFSSAIHASYRLHSEVEITGVGTGQPAISFQWHDCLESHALDSSLTIVDTKKASPRAHFDNPTWDGALVSVHYVGAANMPLITGSPDIDANGTFSVDPMTGQVGFEGSIDSFPWFEAYATANNGAPVTLINETPVGDGPLSLVGDANRAVSGYGQAAVE